MAPEMLKNLKYNFKVDIWALGIMIFELVCGYLPYTGRNDGDILSLLGQIRIPFRLKLSHECVDFLNLCLQEDSGQRATTSQLLQHPFMEQMISENHQLIQQKRSVVGKKDELLYRPHEADMILLKTNDVGYFAERYNKVFVQKVKRKFYSADYQFVNSGSNFCTFNGS